MGTVDPVIDRGEELNSSIVTNHQNRWITLSTEYPQNWDEIRTRVYRRDDYQCQNCGVEGGAGANAELHAHHIVPKASGGSHNEDNLVTLCKDCHNAIHHNNKTAPQNQQDNEAQVSEIDTIESWNDFIDFSHKYNVVNDESDFLFGILSGQKTPLIIENKQVMIQNVEETRRKFLDVKRLINTCDIPAEDVLKNTNIDEENEAKEFVSELFDVFLNFTQLGLEICDLSISYVHEIASINCQECDADLSIPKSYCGNCGASVPNIWKCESCGNIRSDLDKQFCNDCGAEYSQIPESKIQNIEQIFEQKEKIQSTMQRKARQADTMISEVQPQSDSSSDISNSSEIPEDELPEPVGVLLTILVILALLIGFSWGLSLF